MKDAKELRLTSATVVVAPEVKEKLMCMSIDKQMELVNSSMEMVKTSCGNEMLTLLLEIENGELVSRKDSDEAIKQRIADEQYKLLSENMLDAKFNRELKKQTRLVLKMQQKDIIESGKTAIIMPNNTIKILNIPYTEYLAYLVSVLNLFVGSFLISVYSVQPSTVLRIAGIISTVSCLWCITAIANSVFNIIFSMMRPDMMNDSVFKDDKQGDDDESN